MLRGTVNHLVPWHVPTEEYRLVGGLLNKSPLGSASGGKCNGGEGVGMGMGIARMGVVLLTEGEE